MVKTLKLNIALVVTVLTTSMLVARTADAQGLELTVIAPSLNVRSAPSMTAAVVGQLRCGQKIVASAKTADGAWYQIGYNGQAAFVFAQFAQPGGVCNDLAVVPVSDVMRGTVTSEILNVRASPSLDAAVLGQLQRGQTVVARARTADGAWLRIEYDGSPGFVFAQYVSFEVPVVSQPPAPKPRSTAPRLVLADYMMWYQPDSFDRRKMFDVPVHGAYSSDDPDTIRHHLMLAQRACLDGFIGHWLGAREPRTTENFAKLLALSEGTSFRHVILLLENNLPNVREQDLIASIRLVMEQWAPHPNYLKVDGRPVIFFEGMLRPWGSVGGAQAAWARIRQATDPNRQTIWFAEGLTPAFNPLFDGLYVYRIDHQVAPRSWLKQPALAASLRAVAEKHGTQLYFADTIAPGFDDVRSTSLHGLDIRVPAPRFRRDRRNGEYYRETFSVTPRTNGDLLLVKSFNEWVEGTAIEPGTTYGDLYLNLTCELGNAYRTAASVP